MLFYTRWDGRGEDDITKYGNGGLKRGLNTN